jgi:hypothetical protein
MSNLLLLSLSPFTGCNLDVLGASDDKYVNTRHPDDLTAVYWEVNLTTAVKVKTALLINDKWSYDNTNVSYKISIGDSADYTLNFVCQASICTTAG